MSPHLRVLLATPSFVAGSWLMLLTSRILGPEGREIVDWGWVPEADLRDARQVAFDEHEFALACERRYAELERYVKEGNA